MVKSKKKKADFQKVKIKVGRKLKRTNETVINLKMKKIQVLAQFESRGDKDDKEASGSESTFLRYLLSTRSEDRARGCKDLKTVLENLQKRKVVSEEGILEALPLLQLTAAFRKTVLDSSEIVRNGTVKCLEKLLKMLSGTKSLIHLVDTCCDCIHCLFVNSQSEVRWKGVQLMGSLLQEAPLAYAASLRPVDCVLVMDDLNQFAEKEVKTSDTVLPPARRDLLLRVLADLLDAAESDVGEVSPRVEHIGEVIPGTSGTVYKAGWSVRRLVHTNAVNPSFWTGAFSWHGNQSRHTPAVLQKLNEFSPEGLAARVSDWVVPFGLALLEESLNPSSVGAVVSLVRIVVHVQSLAGAELLQSKKLSRLTTRLLGLFPVGPEAFEQGLARKEFEKNSDEIGNKKMKQKAPKKGSKPGAHDTSKKDINRNINYLNTHIVDLMLKAPHAVSKDDVLRLRRYMQEGITMPVSHDLGMEWMRFAEYAVTRLEDTKKPPSIVVDAFINLADKLFTSSNPESRIRRRALVIMVIALSRRWKLYGDLPQFTKSCLKKRCFVNLAERLLPLASHECRTNANLPVNQSVSAAVKPSLLGDRTYCAAVQRLHLIGYPPALQTLANCQDLNNLLSQSGVSFMPVGTLLGIGNRYSRADMF